MSQLQEGRMLLQWLLSDNQPKQAQNNIVVPSQKEMDRVGFEPTTSASLLMQSSIFQTTRVIL
jgi:hypothetical protein